MILNGRLSIGDYTLTSSQKGSFLQMNGPTNYGINKINKDSGG